MDNLLHRHLRLYLAVMRYCLARELEFRTSLVFNLLREGIYASLQVAFVSMIFLNVEAVGEWTPNQMLVLMGTYTIITNVVYFFFWETLTSLSSLVNSGELDLVLTKPVNAQFYVSIRRVTFMNLGPVIFGIGIVIVGLTRLGYVPDPFAVGTYLGLIACGVAICYAMWFCTVLSVFWTGRMQNIGAVFEPIISMARVPTTVLRGPLRLAFTFILPLAFAGTVPAQAILGILDFWFVPYAVAIAVGSVYGSNLLWHRALRAYSSASS